MFEFQGCYFTTNPVLNLTKNMHSHQIIFFCERAKNIVCVFLMHIWRWLFVEVFLFVFVYMCVCLYVCVCVCVCMVVRWVFFCVCACVLKADFVTHQKNTQTVFDLFEGRRIILLKTNVRKQQRPEDLRKLNTKHYL